MWPMKTITQRYEQCCVLVLSVLLLIEGGFGFSRSLMIQNVNTIFLQWSDSIFDRTPSPEEFDDIEKMNKWISRLTLGYRCADCLLISARLSDWYAFIEDDACHEEKSKQYYRAYLEVSRNDDDVERRLVELGGQVGECKE